MRRKLPNPARQQLQTTSSMALSKKEEQARKRSQLQLLSRAFEVLDRMKTVAVKRDALVYRALIDAACRVGSTHHAMLVLREMRNDKMRPDSLFFSCLLSAFAMDGTLGSMGTDARNNATPGDIGQLNTPREALPMGELAAWMKETAEGGGGGDTQSVRSGMSSAGDRQSGRKAHERRLSTMEQVRMVLDEPMAKMPAPSSSSSHQSRRLDKEGAISRLTSARVAMMSASLDKDPDLKSSKKNKKNKKEKRSDSSGTGNTPLGGDNFSESIRELRLGMGGQGVRGVLSESLGSLKLGFTGEDVDALAPEAQRGVSESSPGSPHAPADRNLSRQGYALLELLFPLLHIEADMESCPKCNQPLSKAEVLDGFTDDPNNYTTQCPREGCGKRFVAYFSVLCSSPDWRGTQGPQTPLYFTALSPWVLRKEVLTLLIDSRGDGKKKQKKKTGVVASSAKVALSTADSDRVGAAHLRLSSSTIFWNLVLYFHLFGLPCEFLVDPEEVEEAARAAAEQAGVLWP